HFGEVPRTYGGERPSASALRLQRPYRPPSGNNDRRLRALSAGGVRELGDKKERFFPTRPATCVWTRTTMSLLVKTASLAEESTPPRASRSSTRALRARRLPHRFPRTLRKLTIAVLVAPRCRPRRAACRALAARGKRRQVDRLDDVPHFVRHFVDR